MNLFADFLKFLQRPFPKDVPWFGLSKNIITISVFMTLFLYAFQPSGISDLESNKFLICLGFGFAGTLGYFIFETIFYQITQFQNKTIDWTFGKWWAYSFAVLFMISLANFLYVRYLVFGYMDWQFFPAMLRGVFMFGIPVLLVMTFTLLRDERKYQTIAQAINQQTTDEQSANYSSDLTLYDIPIDQIKYIEALQNYITIFYLDEAGQLKKKTERATLKSILAVTKESPIVRTHRSFLVNRQAITETSGNSQGLLLTLSDCDKKIPVSRSYVASFK